MNEQPAGVPGDGMAVVRQSSAQRDGLMGVLIAVFAVAIWRGYTGAQTTGGRIALVVILGGFAVALAVGWIRLITRRCELQISEQAIAYVEGGVVQSRLTRQDGTQLRFVTLGSGRWRRTGLTVAGPGPVISLGFFSREAIRGQCAAKGWQFAPGR